jgi:LAO/AO transport system kinase
VIGITGPPGSGKSTLTSRLALELRRRGKTVGIVAVDPSSPFTGGAILGDRIRMIDLQDDPEIFMRSMATRGNLGGLARATRDAVLVLDAFGKDVVIIETVGVGQDEVEIVRTADTTLVVNVPGLGDDIQATKAGILEIADILVINKADLDKADRLGRELRNMLNLAPREPGSWLVPILKTVATNDEGITALVDGIAKHGKHLKTTGTGRERRADNTRRWLQQVAEEHVKDLLANLLAAADEQFDPYAVVDRRTDPYAMSESLRTRLRLQLDPPPSQDQTHGN